MFWGPRLRVGQRIKHNHGACLEEAALGRALVGVDVATCVRCMPPARRACWLHACLPVCSLGAGPQHGSTVHGCFVRDSAASVAAHTTSLPCGRQRHAGCPQHRPACRLDVCCGEREGVTRSACNCLQAASVQFSRQGGVCRGVAQSNCWSMCGRQQPTRRLPQPILSCGLTEGVPPAQQQLPCCVVESARGVCIAQVP